MIYNLCDVIHGKGRINTCLYCNVDQAWGQVHGAKYKYKYNYFAKLQVQVQVLISRVKYKYKYFEKLQVQVLL